MRLDTNRPTVRDVLAAELKSCVREIAVQFSTDETSSQNRLVESLDLVVKAP